jgi:Carboxypeptidase regulatory-like domain
MAEVARVAMICVCIALIPGAAFAQASMTGVVRDASGAVIPGVTVEAASPDLIEKVRSVISDSSGQYRIVTLPPGTYTVTFSLAGFSTVRREGVELTGTFTATINADLRVGSLEETVTIPRIDVQLSATFQSIPGPQVLANYVAPTTLAAQSLGRPLAGGSTNATVSIVHPGTMYGERLNQLDLRFAKLPRFGGARTAINVDLYNAFNDNAVLQESTTYGNWRQPQGILIGRAAKFSLQYDF